MKMVYLKNGISLVFQLPNGKISSLPGPSIPRDIPMIAGIRLWAASGINSRSRFLPISVVKIPSLEPEAWVWMNGEYVGHREYLDAYIRPNDVTLDVTKQVKIGETNDITVRVFTGLGAAQAPAGMQSRVVLYSPKQ